MFVGCVSAQRHPTADCVRFPMSAPIVGRRVSQQPARLVWSERHPLGMPSSSDLAREVNIATRRLAACCVWCQGHSCCTVARVSGLRVSEGKGTDLDIRSELFSGMSDKTNRTRQNPEGGRRRGRMGHGRFFFVSPSVRSAKVHLCLAKGHLITCNIAKSLLGSYSTPLRRQQYFAVQPRVT